MEMPVDFFVFNFGFEIGQIPNVFQKFLNAPLATSPSANVVRRKAAAPTDIFGAISIKYCVYQIFIRIAEYEIKWTLQFFHQLMRIRQPSVDIVSDSGFFKICQSLPVPYPCRFRW